VRFSIIIITSLRPLGSAITIGACRVLARTNGPLQEATRRPRMLNSNSADKRISTSGVVPTSAVAMKLDYADNRGLSSTSLPTD
jgi:hypothetical protein